MLLGFVSVTLHAVYSLFLEISTWQENQHSNELSCCKRSTLLQWQHRLRSARFSCHPYKAAAYISIFVLLLLTCVRLVFSEEVYCNPFCWHSQTELTRKAGWGRRQQESFSDPSSYPHQSTPNHLWLKWAEQLRARSLLLKLQKDKGMRTWNYKNKILPWSYGMGFLHATSLFTT